jgi:hypothetical protein
MKLNSKGGALIRATIDDYRHETHEKTRKGFKVQISRRPKNGRSDRNKNFTLGWFYRKVSIKN